MVSKIFLFSILLAGANARFFRFVPEEYKPPTPHYDPKTFPKFKPDTKPATPPQEQVIANNVGGLEKNLRSAHEAMSLGKDLAEAILATGETTTLTATATASINTTLFAPCKAYASILTSCASATASFYDIDPLEQASCACYKASTNSAACAATPTLNAGYDDYEAGCYAFFDYYNYESVAGAMNDSTKLPGAGLCSWAKEEYSIPPTLAAKTVHCASPTPAAQRVDGGGTGASELLTAFDRGVLAIFAVTVTAFSWVFFD